MNKLSSALGALAVLAIAVVFILQFRPASNPARTDNGPQCVADVRGTCISAGSFNAARRLIAMNADQSQLRAMGFKKKVAEGLVEAWVLNQDAKRLGLAVSDEDVTAEIAAGRAHVSLPASDVRSLGPRFGLHDDLVRQIPVKSPKTKKFDAKYAEKQIRLYTMMSPAEFREYQRSEILAERMRDLIRSRVRIGENEAYDEFSRERSTVTLDYVRFDRRFFADLLVDLSPRAVEAWADTHKEELDKVWESRKAQVMPECRSAREIFVKLDEVGSDEEKDKAKAKIARAKDRVQKGEDFGDVARALSDGPTAAHGGELGCLLRGRVPKPLEDAVMKLDAGKVSDVISTESGLHLVKVDQIAKDAEAEKLGRAQTAKELYVAQEAERLAVEAAKKVQAAVKGGKSLKDALDTYLAELAKTVEAQGADKKKGDAKKKADDKKAADKKKGDAKEDDAKKADADPPAPTIATHANRPTLETTLPFNISNDPIAGVRPSADLGKIAFDLAKPGDAPSDVIPSETGYVAIQLKEKTPAPKDVWEKNKEFYLAGMRAAKANDALALYVKRAYGQLASDTKFMAALVEEKAPEKGGDNAPPPEDQGDPGE